MDGNEKITSRERLLLAGLKIFAEKGYAHATFKDICEESQSNIASINYYFRDKERFYLEILSFALERRRRVMQECWELVPKAPWKALRRHIEILLESTYTEVERQCHWLFLRYLIDYESMPHIEMRESKDSESPRVVYENRMTALMRALLGETASTAKNISLLRYTYYSLSHYLLIHTRQEERCRDGKFNVHNYADREEVVAYICNIVRDTVKRMKQEASRAAKPGPSANK